MFNKILRVKPLDDFLLKIDFQNGVTKQYDLKPLFVKWNVFIDLKNHPELFYEVKVDVGGYGISWNEDIDLSCNELWERGV